MATCSRNGRSDYGECLFIFEWVPLSILVLLVGCGI